jgi:hypothetical protein
MGVGVRAIGFFENILAEFSKYFSGISTSMEPAQRTFVPKNVLTGIRKGFKIPALEQLK